MRVTEKGAGISATIAQILTGSVMYRHLLTPLRPPSGNRIAALQDKHLACAG